jgi:hypothetical protein
MGEREINILRNIEEDKVLIKTVTGEASMSKLYGDTIFGKTRILNGHRGSVLVLQYATKKMYQVRNQDEGTHLYLEGGNITRELKLKHVDIFMMRRGTVTNCFIVQWR